MFVELTEVGFDLLEGCGVGYGALSGFEGYTRGVILCFEAAKTVSKASELDFKSRFFGLKVGVPEDAG